MLTSSPHVYKSKKRTALLVLKEFAASQLQIKLHCPTESVVILVSRVGFEVSIEMIGLQKVGVAF